MLDLTPNEKALLHQLRDFAEDDDKGWGRVYLDNIVWHDGRSFAGTLGSLRVKGLYRPIEPLWGEVRLE